MDSDGQWAATRMKQRLSTDRDEGRTESSGRGELEMGGGERERVEGGW